LRSRNSRLVWGLVTLLATLALLLVSGCRKQASGDDVMAKVNGKDILRSEVDKYFKEQTAGAPQQPTAEESESLRLAILRQLIQDQLMLQRAEKLGLMATDDEVDRKLSEMKAPYTTEQWAKELKDRGLSEDDLKRELRRNLTIDKLLNKEVTSKISISDADITAYYNANKAQFNLIEPQYHIAHIWVSPRPDEVSNLKNDKAQSDAEARKKIQMLRNRIASGEDFATLAMNYSEDPRTSANGGDLGLIPESALQRTDSGTRAAVLKLNPGEVSGVITVINPANGQVEGYRIVKLLAREPAGQRDLSDPRVQQSIREMLRQRREQLLKAAYYEVLQDQAKVENLYAEQILKNAGK
jgi:peptidyl-prolyl cis-trans isomerase SurA